VSYVAAHGKSVASLTAGSIHGYTTAFTFSAIVLAVAAVSAVLLVQRGRPTEADAVLAEDEGLVLAGSL
jgi:hypothetical protein